MYYQLTSYIKFLIGSTNQHGVHSPFLYQLVTKCFYDTSNHPEYRRLKEHRKELLTSKRTIEVTDFGAGSRVFKSSVRAVAAIAKTAGITSKRQRLLFRLTRHLKPAQILELGTSLGMGTMAMSLGNSNATITTVEGCPNTSGIAQDLFLKFLPVRQAGQQQNINSITSSFEEYFRKNSTPTYDLVYVDGNHNGDQTLAYFELLRKYAHNDTVLIFDDIYWSPEMNQAWKQIIAHPEVTLSVDTFYWGFVFFRKEQQKEHFKIRL